LIARCVELVLRKFGVDAALDLLRRYQKNLNY